MDIPVPGTTPSFRYAGFWKRFLAYFIDKIILGAISLVFILPLIAVGGLSVLRWDEYDSFTPEFLLALVTAFAGVLVMILVIHWLYFALLESRKGATFGKMALGIAVVDMKGDRISFGRASGRHFGKILSSLILCIGYIIAGFTQQKQALHDILAGCLVINRQ